MFFCSFSFNWHQSTSFRAFAESFLMDSVTRFRFRDPTHGDNTSDGSSVSSIDDDDESRLESMTGKGIKRLCSELLELKKASDEDFDRNVYSNYSTFVRIFKEVGTMDNELMQLKQHVLTQRKLVKDLMDGIYLEILSEESIESIIEESLVVDKYSLNKLEARTIAIAEILDILLSEHRLDEALAILEVGVGTLKRIQLEEDPPLQVVVSSNSVISERKTRLADQFVMVADHLRVAAPEFRKALVGLRRLGESQRATQLLLKFYRSRIANGIQDLQCSKQSLHGTYIRELAKFVFSVISQGARSYEVVYGEKSPYMSEFIQWAREETEVFVCCFNKYAKSISEINGGLSTVAEAVQLAVSFCSLLETQSIILKPYLIKLMRPCMQEVLKMHIDHFKKVIGIFIATDAWVLGKYLISGILKEEASPMIIGHQLQYCLLTSSGRKFITMMQAIMREVSPLVILQMEFSILNGLMDLFRDYIGILITVIPSKVNIERGSSRVILAQTLSQQLSVIANASAIVHIFSSTARSIFKNIDGHPITHHTVASQQMELDNWISSLQEMADRLRDYFSEQFIHRVMSPEGASSLRPETYVDDQRDSDMFQDWMPSVAFQVLFQELRELEKLGKDIFIGADWLEEELLRELVKNIFFWLSNNQDFWSTIEDRPIVHVQQSCGSEQFVLDMQFLVEITRLGGYFCESMVDTSLALIHRMESAFVFAGLVPKRDILADGWATNAAKEAINKLLLNEKTKLLALEEPSRTFEEDAAAQQFECSSSSDKEDKRNSMEDELVTKSVIIDADEETPELEVIPFTGSLDHSEPEVELDDEDTQSYTNSLAESEDVVDTNMTDAATVQLEGSERTQVERAGIVEEVCKENREKATVLPPEKGASNPYSDSESSIRCSYIID